MVTKKGGGVATVGKMPVVANNKNSPKKAGNQAGPRKNQKGKNESGNVHTYFKMFATFKCSNCPKTWQSAHAWEREDDEGGVNCEICERPAELVNAVDEVMLRGGLHRRCTNQTKMLKLDTYLCVCENIWQSIHVPENGTIPQECDICKIMVLPDGDPQERFGRHYWLACRNKACPEQDCVEWEDFSLSAQKTQRCTKCFSRGDIFKVAKLKQLPPWLWIRRRHGRRGEDGEDMEEKPSNHVSEFCDMCQDIRRQGKGKNCRGYRLIKTEDKVDPLTGESKEEIIQLNVRSDNPNHFDANPKKNL